MTVNVQLTEHAQTFIKEKNFEEPLLLVYLGEQLKLRGGGGDPMGFHSIPSYNYVVNIIEGKGVKEPGEGFLKMDTPIGILMYILEPIVKMVEKQQGMLVIDVSGIWKMKHLIIKVVNDM